jgi:cytochrome c oxidase cbb3-type subunit 4
MDLNLLRSVVTVSSLVLFVALMVMVWLPRRKAEFDEAAVLPFTGESDAASPTGRADATGTERNLR